MAVEIPQVPSLSLDKIISFVSPYVIPAIAILLVLGIVFFFLRNLKSIIILGVLALILLYFGAIPKVPFSFSLSPQAAVSNQSQPSASGNYFFISNVSIGKEMSNGVVIDDRVFKSSDSMLSVGFSYKGAMLGKTISIKLRYGQTNMAVAEKTLLVIEPSSYAAVSFPRPSEGWKLGNYVIDVYYDGKQAQETIIQVVG